MKLLLDQGLPLSAATLLRDEGMDAIHLTLPRLKPMGFFKTCLKGIVKYPPRHF